MDEAEAIAHNEACWDRAVEKGAGSTIPCLDLDRDMVRRFARGDLSSVAESLVKRGDLPGIDLTTVEDKDVLCLGAGGGQQSAILSLLGAHVTVVEISQRQLDGDRGAATHYGYEICLIHGDMQDLSCLADGTFDIVYSPCTMYVPDIRALFRECARVLRPGGLLTAGILQPARQCRYLADLVDDDRYDPSSGDSVEYIHYMDDIFNGLGDVGLGIERVFDEGRDSSGSDGSSAGALEPTYVDDGGYFIVAARRQRDHMCPQGRE